MKIKPHIKKQIGIVLRQELSGFSNVLRRQKLTYKVYDEFIERTRKRIYDILEKSR